MKRRLLAIVFALLMLCQMLSFSILATDINPGENETEDFPWGNLYTVTLPTGTGYTAAFAEGFSNSVNEGDDCSFTVAIADGYAKDTNFAVKANGVALDAVDDVYTITNVTEDQTITVEGVIEEVVEPAVQRGDANNDGAVDAKDITRIKLLLAGKIDSLAGNGDANEDGAVDAKDITRIKLYIAGKISLENM